MLADGVVRYRGEAVLALVGDARRGAGDPRRRAADPPGRRAAACSGIDAATAPDGGARCRPTSRGNVLLDGRVGAATSTLPSPTCAAVGRGRPSRRASSSTPTSSPRPAGRRRVGDRAARSMPAPRRPTWTATRSRASCGSRPSRCTSCRRRAAAASAASSISRCSRCSRSPPGSSAGRCALVYTRPESMAASTKRHPARVTAKFGCDAAGQLAGLRRRRRLRHRRLCLVGADRGQPRADPRHRPVPRCRTCAPGARPSSPTAAGRRLSRLRRAAGGDRARGDDRRAGRPARHRPRSSSATAMRCAPATRRRPGSGSRPASACAQCLDALRPHWQQGAARRRRVQRRWPGTGSALRRGVGIACMWYGIGNTVDRQSVDDARRRCAAPGDAHRSTTARTRSARASQHHHAADLRRRGRPAAGAFGW